MPSLGILLIGLLWVGVAITPPKKKDTRLLNLFFSTCGGIMIGGAVMAMMK